MSKTRRGLGGSLISWGRDLFHSAERTRRLRRQLESLPETSGEVSAVKALHAPLSGKEAVGYSLVVEEQWSAIQLLERTRINSFELKTEAGPVLVEGEVELFLDRKQLFWGEDMVAGLRRLPGDDVVDLLFTRGEKAAKQLQAMEYRLQPGDQVFLFAHLAPIPDASSAEFSFREAPTRLAARGTQAAPLIISTRPRDVLKKRRRRSIGS